MTEETRKEKRSSNARRTGQIVKRGDGRFLVRVFLGRDSNGKRHYHNHTVRGSKKDAQVWLNGALRRLDLGEAIEQTDILFGDFVKRWLETAVKPRIRARSYESYVDKIDNHILPVLEKKHLAHIKAYDLDALYTKLADDGLSRATIVFVRGLVHNIFKQAVQWDMMRVNPAKNVGKTPQGAKSKPPMKYFNRAQAREFFRINGSDRYFPAYAFLLATGVRVGEMMALKWTDIDIPSATVSVTQSLYWQRNYAGWVLTEPKNKKSVRTLPLERTILGILRDWKLRQELERASAGKRWQDDNFAFTQEDGVPVYLDSLRKRFKDLLAKAELPILRIHDLRHSFATILLAEGVNVKIVSEMLGHSSIVQTLETYSHVIPGLKEEAARKIESALFGEPELASYLSEKERKLQLGTP